MISFSPLPVSLLISKASRLKAQNDAVMLNVKIFAVVLLLTSGVLLYDINITCRRLSTVESVLFSFMSARTSSIGFSCVDR